MESNKKYSSHAEISAQIKAELDELEKEEINAEGIKLKPSQCYHFEQDPLHVLFNTNCPQELRTKIESIISRYNNLP